MRKNDALEDTGTGEATTRKEFYLPDLFQFNGKKFLQGYVGKVNNVILF